jgi:hypothetical protein
MAPIHEHSTGTSSAILPCCAAHLGIDVTSEAIGGAYDGCNHWPGMTGQVRMWKEDGARRRAVRLNGINDQLGQSADTVDSQYKQAERRRESKSKKNKQAMETTPTAKFPPDHAKTEKGSGFTTTGRKQNDKTDKEGAGGPSKPTQGNDASSEKSALKATTNKVARQSRSKPEQKSWAREGDSFSDSSAGGYFDPSSKDDKPIPKKSVRKPAANNNSSQAKSKTERHPQAHNEGASNGGCSLCPVSKDDQTSGIAMVRFANSVNTPKEKSPEFGSITLADRRRMQFCGFSDELASQLGNEIAKYGGRGIERERKWRLSYEFKLIGDPWGQFKNATLGDLTERQIGRVVGDLGAAREEKFLRHMFNVMHLNGYSLHLTSQMFESIGTFFFEKSPKPPNQPIETMTISFHSPNRLRLTCAPEEFIPAVEKLLRRNPRFKGERQKTQKPKNDEPPAVEYKIPDLSRNTWHVWFRWAPEKRVKVTKGRVFKLDLIKLLKDQGWKGLVSLDRGMRTARKGDEHVGTSWYYYKEKSIHSEK